MERSKLYIFLIAASVLLSGSAILYFSFQIAPEVEEFALSSPTSFLVMVVAFSTIAVIIGSYSLWKRKKLKNLFRPMLLDEDACGILKFIGKYGYFAAFVAANDLELSKKLDEVLTNFFIDCLQHLFTDENKEQALISLTESINLYIPRKSDRESINFILANVAILKGYTNKSLLKIIKN